ncbi:MAG TPA: antibiotic biosynthesis monooxygenase [Acidimicrobiales bacterium]|nr:antibiotic biosynthesis monooxygenase [Acidimicrobiales bacterium]
MSEFLRLYQSAVAPADVEEIKRLFADDVVPAFSGASGCLGIELAVNVEPNAGGLVEGTAISRWKSLDDMAAALASREVREALVRIRQLLRQEPVSKVLQVL